MRDRSAGQRQGKTNSLTGRDLLAQVADGLILALSLTRLGLESSASVLERAAIAQQLRHLRLQPSFRPLAIRKLPAERAALHGSCLHVVEFRAQP